MRYSVGGAWIVPALTAACSWMAGCSPPDALTGRGDVAPPHRASDGLLTRIDLQDIVDLQVMRAGPALTTRLADPDPAVRARAAFALGSVQDPGAGPALVGLLGDPEARVRTDAAFALGQLDATGSRALAAALDDESDPDVRAALIEAIGKVGDLSAVGSLVALAGEEALPAATLSLSRAVLRGIVPAGVIDTLVVRMTHGDPRVRFAASYFVSRAQDVSVWINQENRLRSILDGYAMDEPAARHLVAGLGRTIDRVTEPRVLARLRNAVDWRERAVAAAALENRDALTAAAAVALLDALDDPSPHVRLQAAQTLAAGEPLAGLPEAIEDWVAAHPDDLVTAGPLLGFLAMTGEGDLLIERLSEMPLDETTGWFGALDALSYLPGEDALALLSTALGSPSGQVARTAMASLSERWRLARVRPESHETFLTLLSSAAPRAHAAVLEDMAVILADSVLTGRGAEAAAGIRMRIEVEPAGASADSGRGASARERHYRTIDWPALAELGDRPRLVLETERGPVVLALLAEEAPLTVQAIVELAREGRYDGVPFHRVLPNFVAQGGDVTGGGGAGGPGFTLRSEFTRLPYLSGVLGMASGGKDTEGSQFFITHSPQPHLDGGYTAFGWVESGQAVVDRLRQGDRILHARVVGHP